MNDSNYNNHTTNTTNTTNTSEYSFETIFSTSERMGSWFLTMLCLSAFVLNVSVIFTLQKSVYRKSSFNVILIQLFFTDLLLGATNAPIFLLNSIYGWWRAGWIGCQFISVTSILFCCASMCLLAFIAFERYMIIVHERPLSSFEIWLGIGLIWCLSTVLGCFTLYSATLFPIGQTTSRFFCVYRWYRRSSFYVSTLFASFCILVLCSCMLLIFFFNYSIYQKLLQLKSNLVLFRHVHHPHLHEQQQQQQKDDKQNVDVAKRMAMLVLIFIINWIWYLCNMMYQVTTGKDTVAWFDGWSTIMGYANSFMNPIVYVLLDKSYSCKTVERPSYTSPIPTQTQRKRQEEKEKEEQETKQQQEIKQQQWVQQQQQHTPQMLHIIQSPYTPHTTHTPVVLNNNNIHPLHTPEEEIKQERPSISDL